MIDEICGVEDEACHGEVSKRREDQVALLLSEHAMDLDQAEGECDRESHDGKDKLIVAELFPPD